MTVYVNAIMYYKVYDSNMAVSAVDDYNTSTRSLAAAALRNILGTRNLGEILSERSLTTTTTATATFSSFSLSETPSLWR